MKSLIAKCAASLLKNTSNFATRTLFTLTLFTLTALGATSNIEETATTFARPDLFKKYSHEPGSQEIKIFKKLRAKKLENIKTLRAKPGSNIKANPKNAVDWRPAPETADFKYVLLSSEAGFAEAANLRYTIAKNLPEGVKLVLLVTGLNAEQTKQTYSQYISPERIILAKDSSIEGGFWARDAFPYPVLNQQNQLSLVGARYYRTFNSSLAVATSLSLNIRRNNFTFVGGNLMADENANCFTIDSYRRFTTTDNDLLNIYGCKTLKVLPHYSGIGDVDEVVKMIGNNTVLTNTQQYVADFKAWGYNVVMIPSIPNSYRTYVNSLVVGRTVFMPTYGVVTDAQAQKVYEDLGYKVVGIRSNTLSDSMHGSVHCQTMAYPAMNEQQLMDLLGTEKIN